MAGATLVGLSCAGGTYALLSATEEVPEATITAGTLDLRVNGSSSAALGTWTVTPTTPVARAFTVSSASDVPSTLSASARATTSQAIIGNTQLRITPVASAAACTVGLSGPLGDVNGYSVSSLGRLAETQTRTFCLEVRLKAGTPVTQSGQGVGFALEVTATQEAN